MHLLSTLPADGSDVEAAIDLGQSPGEIVLLSAADTDLACFATAQASLPADTPSLRLANLLQLSHPLSVDLYVERVVARSAAGHPSPAGRPRLLALRARADRHRLRRGRHPPGLSARRRSA